MKIFLLLFILFSCKHTGRTFNENNNTSITKTLLNLQFTESIKEINTVMAYPASNTDTNRFCVYAIEKESMEIISPEKNYTLSHEEREIYRQKRILLAYNKKMEVLRNSILQESTLKTSSNSKKSPEIIELELKFLMLHTNIMLMKMSKLITSSPITQEDLQAKIQEVTKEKQLEYTKYIPYGIMSAFTAFITTSLFFAWNKSNIRNLITRKQVFGSFKKTPDKVKDIFKEKKQMPDDLANTLERFRNLTENIDDIKNGKLKKIVQKIKNSKGNDNFNPEDLNWLYSTEKTNILSEEDEKIAAAIIDFVKYTNESKWFNVLKFYDLVSEQAHSFFTILVSFGTPAVGLTGLLMSTQNVNWSRLFNNQSNVNREYILDYNKQIQNVQTQVIDVYIEAAKRIQNNISKICKSPREITVYEEDFLNQLKKDVQKKYPTYSLEEALDISEFI